MSKKIHIANDSGETLLVMVVNNKDFIPSDIGFGFLKTAVVTALTAGTGTGPAAAETASKLLQSVKTMQDLYSTYSKLENFYKMADAASQKYLHSNMQYVRDLVTKGCKIVAPGSFEMVNEKFIAPYEGIEPLIAESYKKDSNILTKGLIDMVNEHAKNFQLLKNTWTNIDPSISFGALPFVGDLTIFIATVDFRKICTFNTNCDHSWIIKQNEIVRAKHGKIWQEDREAGRQIFSNACGVVLVKNEHLLPHDSLDVQSINFEGPGEFLDINETKFITVSKEEEKDSFFSVATLKKAGRFIEKELNSVGKTVGNVIHGVANAPSVIFAYPYKLTYQPDGNLVLYHIKGDHPKPVWASDTDGKPAGKVRMQEDGNFVMYGPKGEVQWALWKEVPKGYENSFVGLDNKTGKLAYYKSGNNKPDFFISDKKDWYRP